MTGFHRLTRRPDDVDEIPVFEHPSDVRVGPLQRLVERLEIVLPQGDMGTMDIPGDLGEPFDESRFARRRQEVLQEAVRALDPEGAGEEPDAAALSVFGRSYALWSHREGKTGEHQGSLLWKQLWNGAGSGSRGA